MSCALDSIAEFIFAQSERLEPADVILVPGGSQPQLMEKAVGLYRQGLAPLILPSGGPNKRLQAEYASEWQFLQDIALKLGVPKEAILKEDQARHTFDNARLSLKVLQEHGVVVNRAILVCKSFHARRALLTYQYSFPGHVTFSVAPALGRLAAQKTIGTRVPRE